MASEERFGYEWSQFNAILPEYEEQFLKWVSPLAKNYFRRKVILDAGCGIGRNSFWPLIYGAKSIYAFDHDKRTVKVAKQNLKKFPNAKVEFLNIYSIPYSNLADLSHAIGVIQHLENPDAAIKELVKATKKGGLVLVWVLAKEGNIAIIFIFNILRLATSRLPLPIVDLFSYIVTIPIFLLVRLAPIDHPYIKQISNYHFGHTRSIVLDHLIPRIINYWSKSEAKNLLAKAGLSNIQITRVNRNSWTVIGAKR